MLNPVINRRFTDHIVKQLKEYILASRPKSGKKLPNETELAETFGVSRGTIREALHMLEHDGIVQIKKGPGGGIFVSEGNFFQVIESIFYALQWEHISFGSLMEARKTLEDRIARLAALKATDEDLKEIETTLEKMESPNTSHSLFVQYDTDFHVSLAKAAKNKILLMFMTAVREFHNRIVDYAALHDDLFPKAISYHRNIYEAVYKRDPKRAAELMLEHLEYFENYYRDLTEEKS